MIITIDTDEIEKMVREAFRAGVRGALGLADQVAPLNDPDGRRANAYAAEVVRRLLAERATQASEFVIDGVCYELCDPKEAEVVIGGHGWARVVKRPIHAHAGVKE